MGLVDLVDRYDTPGARQEATGPVEAAILRIAKHEPPAALADAELLRDITVGEGHRLGKPDAIPVREFARAVRKVRPATCAPIERLFMIGRAQQIEDRPGAVGLPWPHL